MIGPNVIQAIIDNSGDNWKGFPFLFALCTSASLVIWIGVDVEKGRRDAIRFSNEYRSSDGAHIIPMKYDVKCSSTSLDANVVIASTM